MAKGIKGITIEIGGETTGLQKALGKVNKGAKEVQDELKQVDKLLKFNPGNTELIAQKQKLLGDQIGKTSEKLDVLRAAQEKVEKAFKAGDLKEEQYRSFNRELVQTESQLKSLKDQMGSLQKEQDDIGKSTQRMERYFEAAGKSVDDFSDTLGSGLTSAIKRGTANSRQLEIALEKIGKAALGNDADIDRFKKSLDSIDDGKSIQNVKKDLQKLSKDAQSAKKETDGLGDSLTNLVAGAAAGAGIGSIIEKSFDISSLDTKIEISFEVPESSKKSVKEAVRSVVNYGVDAEESLEGVRRQWALNKNASDEANASIVKGAAAIASSYSGIDFTELIQETNEIASGLNITNEEALGLVNTLLKMGFPPEQLDIIAEYGMQLESAGFNAAEIQAIFAAGIDTKSWNIDNLLDGVKEGRIRMAEFGEEIPKAFGELLDQTDMSQAKFQKWGEAVAKGGEGGAKAMSDMVAWLNTIEDETTRNAIATQVFGTMWEDQGNNLTSVFQGVNGAIDQTKSNTDGLNDSISKLDQDPTVQFREALGNLMIALAPVMQTIANVVTKITEWAAANPTLVATIVAIVTAVGALLGIFVALTPVIAAIVGLAGVLGVSIGAVAAPVLIVIGVIAALVAAGVALWKNWDTIKAKASSIWNSVKSTISEKVTAAASVVTTKFNDIKKSIVDKITTAKTAVGEAVEAIKGFFSGLKLKIPDIKLPKLPRLNISGKLSINPPSVPKLNWYDKGGVFYGPQVIGVGEKRPEFVGALDDLRAIVSASMREVMNGGGTTNNSTSSTVNFDGFMRGATLVVREEADIEKIARELYRHTKAVARRNGVVT